NLNTLFDFDVVRRLPQVASSADANFYFVVGHFHGRRIDPNNTTFFGSPDGRFGGAINRFVVVRGRLARAQDEIVVSRLTADPQRLSVGDHMQLRVFGPAALGRAF